MTADSFFRQYDEVDRDFKACYQLSALISRGAGVLIGAPALVLPITPPSGVRVLGEVIGRWVLWGTDKVPAF